MTTRERATWFGGGNLLAALLLYVFAEQVLDLVGLSPHSMGAAMLYWILVIGVTASGLAMLAHPRCGAWCGMLLGAAFGLWMLVIGIDVARRGYGSSIEEFVQFVILTAPLLAQPVLGWLILRAGRPAPIGPPAAIE